MLCIVRLWTPKKQRRFCFVFRRGYRGEFRSSLSPEIRARKSNTKVAPTFSPGLGEVIGFLMK